MRYFPQLAGGASGQFPLVRKTRRRTARCEQTDGREWKIADNGIREVEWVLEWKGLSRSEWSELESLFHETEGRRGSFVFLDPWDNLFVWSENLAEEAWIKDPYLALIEGVEDPFGGTTATRLRNDGATTQGIEQALAAPGWYQYCFSVWVRGGVGEEVTLYGRTGTAGEARRVKLSGRWRRMSLPVKLSGGEELIKFGLEVDAGGSVEVFGMQVEAQAGASQYKSTRQRGGVYREARFGDDVLEVVAEGSDCFACRVRVVAAN